MGPLIIMSGPSGSGKSTLIARVLEERTWPLRLSVSATTRPPRAGERDGVHYHFWTPERFLQEREAGGFLESAENFGNYYGTLKQDVEPYRQQGLGVLLDVDVKGWRQVKQHCPDAVSIFVRPSTLEVLERRLRERKTETEESLQRRLEGARAELALAPHYDHQVINDDLDTALAQVRAVLGPLFERKRA
jgi:guanylate kinase